MARDISGSFIANLIARSRLCALAAAGALLALGVGACAPNTQVGPRDASASPGAEDTRPAAPPQRHERYPIGGY
jgi:hypothetical protein